MPSLTHTKMLLKNSKKLLPGKIIIDNFFISYLYSDPSSHPVIPSFCNDMSDSTEVILKGCVVRDNRVFIKGKLIRPLNSLERETVNNLLVARSPAYTPHTLLFEKRRKRDTSESDKKNTTTEAPANDVHNDVAHFIENILKVNSTVAKRFLPVAKMSPLLNELSDSAVKVASQHANSKESESKLFRLSVKLLTNSLIFSSFARNSYGRRC